MAFWDGGRRRPRWSELRELIKVRAPRLSREARVAGAATIWDLRRIGRRRTPRAAFDYVHGAAEAEITLRRSREVYRRVEFFPNVLRDVAEVDTTTTILGEPSTLPLALSPTGSTRMMHAEGEKAVAGAADAVGIPYALSSLGTTSVEDLADAAPGLNRWFQLYVWRDRAFSQGSHRAGPGG